MQSAMSIHYLSFYQPNCLIPINKNSRTADFAFGSFLFSFSMPVPTVQTPYSAHRPYTMSFLRASTRARPRGALSRIFASARTASERKKSRRRRKQIAVFPPPRGNVKVYRNPRNFSRETGVIFRNQTRDLMRRMMSFMLTLPSPLKSAAASLIVRPDQPA